MLSIASRSRVAAVAPGARAIAASPWGTDHWRHDKQEFIRWATKAAKDEKSRQGREFFAHCAVCFGDVDTDKDASSITDNSTDCWKPSRQHLVDSDWHRSLLWITMSV